MPNKRLFIKYLLSNYDEGTLFDRKESVDFTSSNGRSKILKHICALCNSNPSNESFLVIGVADDNTIVGSDFIDDAMWQNLTSAFLQNPPLVKYENISFPTLDKGRSVGLLTIYPQTKESSFRKSISAVAAGSKFHRIGSKSEPVKDVVVKYPANRSIVDELALASQITLTQILDGTINFMKFSSKEYNPSYVVFREQFVICWSGWKSAEFYSEVDIQIINDAVRIFFSAVQDVKIEITDGHFRIVEYVYLGYHHVSLHVPFEITTITFDENGTYTTVRENIFVAPVFPRDDIEELYSQSKFQEARILAKEMDEVTEGIAMDFFICYLGGIAEAREDFLRSRCYLDGASGEWHQHCLRILNAYEGFNEDEQEKFLFDM